MVGGSAVAGARQVLIRTEPHLGPEAGQASQISFAALVPALPLITSLAYLVPALVALRTSAHWRAATCVVMAVVCVLDHLCDAKEEYLFLRGRVVCPAQGQQLLDLVACTWIHVCALHLAFSLLGPEDPWIRKSCGGLEGSKGAPRGVVSLARVLPVVGLCVFLQPANSRPPSHLDFWRHGALFSEAVLCLGCAVFWGCNGQLREYAPKVLLNGKFWSRFWRCFVLPSASLLLLGATAAATGSRALWALLHVAAAALLATTFAAELSGQSGIDYSSPGRDSGESTVSQKILCAPAVVMLPTMVLAVAGYSWQHGWRWPTLSMAATSRVGRFVLHVACLPLAAAAGGMVWVIDRAPAHGVPLAARCAPSLRKVDFRRLSCRCNYGGIAIGVAAALCVEGTPLGDRVHTAAATCFFVAAYLGIVFFTAGSECASRLGRLRVALATGSIVGMPIYGVMFLLVNRYVENSGVVPHWLYAATEYVQLALMVVVYVTAWEEVGAVAP